MRLPIITGVIFLLHWTGATSISSDENTGVEVAESLVALTEVITDVSTCNHPVSSFEQEMRKIDLAIQGITYEDENKYKRFLVHVFNTKKSLQYSCIKTIAFAREVVSGFAGLERLTNMIPKYSQPKLGKLLQLTQNKFNMMVGTTVEALQEIKTFVQSVEEDITGIEKLSRSLTSKLKYLRNNGPPVEIELRRTELDIMPISYFLRGPYEFVNNDYFKRKVEAQIDLFQKAQDFYTKSITNNLLNILGNQLDTLKKGQALLAQSTPTNNISKWNQVVTQLQTASHNLEYFLSQGREDRLADNTEDNDNGKRKEASSEERNQVSKEERREVSTAEMDQGEKVQGRVDDGSNRQAAQNSSNDNPKIMIQPPADNKTMEDFKRYKELKEKAELEKKEKEKREYMEWYNNVHLPKQEEKKK